MSCFDCSKAVPKKCKGDCCGLVPINKTVFEIYRDRMVTKPSELFEFELDDEILILPITQNATCCFLGKDYRCKIYESRPQVCKDFGLIPELKCPYIKASGELRTTEEIKEVNKTNKNIRENILNKIKNIL